MIFLEILMLCIETEKIIKSYTYIPFSREHSSHFYIIFSILNSNQTVQVSSGTDIAMDSSQVVIMNDNLEKIDDLIEISRKTIRNIKQNLFWAFGYNVLGIPVAMGLLHIFGGPLLNPMIAAAAMSLSSVSVLTNALRLRRFS